MPYRSRPTRWELLTNPVLRGLEMEARGDAQRNRGILAGLTGVARGIDTRRTEAESRRRFDESMGLRQDALDLRREKFEYAVGQEAREKEEREAFDVALMRSLGEETLAAQAEKAMTGQVSPERQQRIERLRPAAAGASRRMTPT